MAVKSKYVVECYSFDEDMAYRYAICEYCDGGNLLNHQTKQPNKVFSLKNATEILSEVIQGLEHLHKLGYLHRNLKP